MNKQIKQRLFAINRQLHLRIIHLNMFIYHIIQYSLLLLICTYLVNYYAGKSVSFHIKFWSVITWTLNFAITLLVPQDVYQTLNPHAKGPHGPHQQLSPLGWQYLILYWLVYILTWTIIPVLQEWENSGDLQSSARLKRSLKVNGVFYLWMIVGAVIALLVLIYLNVGGQMGLITFLKCLATIWGLILLMILMGYALVEIPRTLWNNADPKTYLAYLYTKVNDVQDQLQEARQQFTKIAGYIMYVQKQTLQMTTKQTEQIQRYCNQSIKLIPEQYMDIVDRKSNYFYFLKQINYLQDYPISLESSIQHLRLLKRVIGQCRRLERGFDDYCNSAMLYEDILRSSNSKKIYQKNAIKEYEVETQLTVPVSKINSKSYTSIQESLLKNKIETQNNQLNTSLFLCKWYHSLWYLNVRKVLNRILAVIIGIGAVILLIAETQVFLTQKSSILGWLIAIRNFQILRIVVFVVIVFIMYTVNYSLFRLKLSNLYGLYEKDSDGPSLMFATVNFSRVGVVIVLNFFDMMKMDSQYKAVMGTVDMGLLGEWVIKGLPGILWLMVLTHYFNFWGKLMNTLKLNDSLGFNSHNVSPDNFNMKGLKTVMKRRQKIEKDLSHNFSPNKNYS